MWFGPSTGDEHCDKAGLYAEMYRVLKAGGLRRMSDWN